VDNIFGSVNRSVTIIKVENGWVVKVVEENESGYEKAMLKLFQISGMYESWQEHKEEELRQLVKNIKPPFHSIEEKVFVFKQLDEAFSFARNFVS